MGEIIHSIGPWGVVALFAGAVGLLVFFHRLRSRQSFGRWAILAAILLLTVGIAGCGTSDQSANTANTASVKKLTAKEKAARAEAKSLAAKKSSQNAVAESLSKKRSDLEDELAAKESAKAEAASKESARQAAASSSAAAQSSSLAAAAESSKQAAAAESSKQAAASSSQAAAAAQQTQTAQSQRGDMNTAETGTIVGNVNSKIYHVPGQAGYRMNSANAVHFNTEQDAINAGYRKALR
ncbi:sunset domain-containing protein [Schleiferilactobacillus harbinensis]|uniref:DNA-entry nuclease n=1 Tax=Schleiferilactobacillus harbinensis TaxID=304207 RepID=A0A5P8M7R7_9LACO|nr:DNA-entry nuclease [Schleiferilactobacillus harbinensis]QFR24121.1 DNA-entry nuclease [Schleiferilactobacillus harbinensis]